MSSPGHKTAPLTRRGLLLMVGLLLLVYGLMLTSAVQKSATVDEQTHWQRGTAYLQHGATQFLIGNPVVGHAFSSLMILTEPALRQPTEYPAWSEGNWSAAGHLFLWEINENPLRIIFLGRLVTLCMTLLLAALVCRWGRDLGGWPVGIVAATLLAFDPNILAHGRLATNDLTVSFFICFTVWSYWRHGRSQRIGYLFLTGLSLGVAAAMKFNGLLLVPILAALSLWRSYQTRQLRPLFELIGVGLLSWIVIWALFGFQWRPLPGGAFWQDLFWQLDYLGGDQGVYLLGELSTGGWWYYFPVAFLAKTPSLTLILLLAVLLLPLSRRRAGALGNDHYYLWLAPLIYFGLTFINALNIGYRYLLPILPFVALLIAVRMWLFWPFPEAWRKGIYGLAGLLPILAIWLWPHYLPFFNSFVDGPAGGWQLLSDSNIDWGQDLPALARWQANTGERVWLSYFGTAVPSAYGVDFSPLPTWPPTPEQLPANRQGFVANNPAPGIYALSVTHLHGAVLGDDKELYAHFRDLEPLERLGGSIFLYEVAAAGETVNIALGGLNGSTLPAAIASPAGNNNRLIRWFDPVQALLLPEDGFAVTNLPLPLEFLPFANTAIIEGVTVIDAWSGGMVDPVTFADLLSFRGYQTATLADGQRVILTRWRIESATAVSLKLFLHEVDESGNIVTQWDGLGADSVSWQAGDQLFQLMMLPPVNQPDLQWRLGVYEEESFNRLVLAEPAGADFLLLDPQIHLVP